MKVVLHLLRNASGLTSLLTGGSNGIYVGKAKQGVSAPYIVVTEQGRESYRTSDSGADLMKFDYRVFIFGNNIEEVQNIRGQVNNILDYASKTTHDGDVLHSSYLIDTDLLALTEDNIDYYLLELIYEIILTTN